MPKPVKRGIYHCTTHGCKRKEVQFEAMLPNEFRAATGKALTCNKCGKLVTLIRVITVAS